MPEEISIDLGNVAAGVFVFFGEEGKPHIKSFGLSREQAAYLLLQGAAIVTPKPETDLHSDSALDEFPVV